MRRVSPHSVWIGHDGDGRNFPELHESDVQAVVQLAIEEPAIQPPRDLVFLRIPLSDGAGNPSESLILAVRTVAQLIGLGIPTLVCCGAGMSRSPCIVAAALSLALQLTPEEALDQVKNSGPCDIAPSLWAETRELLAAWRSDVGL
ncbi:MAG: protein tyrosine phosphatase [Paludisphaera borealis]|uniref:protein-tyrosine phosphatase family protein n=1 Tax=Paludisphaera borealis TaxID=1387353 RepID=UPI00283DAEC2|nr:protein tyrosine phosphatase [Paludisphaera borealis]MDR3622359.1 protein tyrosine phosphatase [Paludisphaera borealis]